MAGCHSHFSDFGGGKTGRMRRQNQAVSTHTIEVSSNFKSLKFRHFFPSNKTRKEPVKKLPIFWHKSKTSPEIEDLFQTPAHLSLGS